jgi:hypothetical protein
MPVPTHRLGLLVLLLSLTTGCHRSAPAEEEEPRKLEWFRDVTEEVGLDFVHDAGPPERYFMPQIMGSGAALFDFDNDGRLDVYLVQNGGPDGPRNRLFRQGRDGRFTDVSKGSGLDVAGWGMGVAVGDVNNDGWPDVLVTEYGGVRLFLNNRDGTFTDVTREAGLDKLLWGTSAAFFDYDRDGWLDLVVVNYIDYEPSRPCASPGGQRDFCGPKHFPGSVTKLYRNLGGTPGKAGAVRFEDVTLKAGLGGTPGPGLGVVCADFTGDGWPDIFVANDGEPNRLWVNQKNGTFKNEALQRGLAYNALGQAQANMGIALGDVDGSGLFSVFVTHLTEETNTLWKQARPGAFEDRTAAAGLVNPRWRGTGFGTVLADFDHDGALDLAVVNGRVARDSRFGAEAGRGGGPGSFWKPYADRNQLFANDGKGGFRDVSPENEAFCGTARISRALAVGDVDGDGALDLLVSTVAGPARLYRNVAPDRGHWLMVRAVDPALGGRDAYGAEVTVEAAGRRWKRWLNPASSYLCSSDPRAHFGLGAAERVDAIHVLWPDGTEEDYRGCPAIRLWSCARARAARSEANGTRPARSVSEDNPFPRLRFGLVEGDPRGQRWTRPTT